jgi:SAM-dependent MidA family methyltransferase
MKTFSTKMALVNKDWYEKDGVRYFSTLARDPFFARAMAEYCYGYFKNHPKDKLNIFEIGPGDGNFFQKFYQQFHLLM